MIGIGIWKMENGSVHWDNGIWGMKCGIKNLRSKIFCENDSILGFPPFDPLEALIF